MDNKRWKKERTRHMKKLHGLMLAGQETIHPRDLTEAIAWFVPEEFASLPNTKRFHLLGRDYYLIAGNIYEHGAGEMVKLNPNEREMELVLKLIEAKADDEHKYKFGTAEQNSHHEGGSIA